MMIHFDPNDNYDITKINNNFDELSKKPGKDLGGQTVSTGPNTTATAGVGAEIFNDYRDRTYDTSENTTAGNTASGTYSHAEGGLTTARGTYTHTEGYRTLASGMMGSHAEGNKTTAAGMSSHAEGGFTIANSPQSHAEGNHTVANGSGSHAEGSYTTSVGKAQHVEGEYNLPDAAGGTNTRGTYVHIVGNGTGEGARSNAHTLDWDGNAWFAGDVESATAGKLSEKAGITHTHTAKEVGAAAETHTHTDYAPLLSPEFAGTPKAPAAATDYAAYRLRNIAIVSAAPSGAIGNGQIVGVYQ